MRGLSGTSALRALVVFDEVYGFLPHPANPPIKRPPVALSDPRALVRPAAGALLDRVGDQRGGVGVTRTGSGWTVGAWTASGPAVWGGGLCLLLSRWYSRAVRGTTSPGSRERGFARGGDPSTGTQRKRGSFRGFPLVRACRGLDGGNRKSVQAPQVAQSAAEGGRRNNGMEGRSCRTPCATERIETGESPPRSGRRPPPGPHARQRGRRHPSPAPGPAGWTPSRAHPTPRSTELVVVALEHGDLPLRTRDETGLDPRLQRQGVRPPPDTRRDRAWTAHKRPCRFGVTGRRVTSRTHGVSPRHPRAPGPPASPAGWGGWDPRGARQPPR